MSIRSSLSKFAGTTMVGIGIAVGTAATGAGITVAGTVITGAITAIGKVSSATNKKPRLSAGFFLNRDGDQIGRQRP
jgi:hypothetical protein